MIRNRLRRGAALIYVAATGTGITLMLGGLTMFTAEASRKDELTTESVVAAADSHALFEKGRLIVRETAYTVNSVDNMNLEFEGTNEGLGAKSSPTDLILSDRPLTSLELGLLPFELTNRQGKTGVMIEPVDDATYRAVVKELVLGLPLGDATAFDFPAHELRTAQQNGYAWVRGGKLGHLRTGVNGTETATYRGSRKSTKFASDAEPAVKRVHTKTVFNEMPGGVNLAISIKGHRSTFARNRVVGVPWNYSASTSQLAVRSNTWSGTGPTAVAHMDLRPTTPRPAAITEGLVESRLGPQGFPIATAEARSSASPVSLVSAYAPTTYELLWWRAGQTGTRRVANPTQGQTSVPFSWTNQSLPNDAENNPQFRAVHLSGGFEITSSAQRNAVTMNLTSQDDAWVFINGQLAMDMGGLHSSMTSTQLNRAPIVVGKNRIDIFHANRGGTSTLGFLSNVTFTPEAPFTLNSDHAFGTMGATIVGGAVSTHSELVDGGELDADNVAITLNPPGNTSGSYSMTYDAETTTGIVGKKFGHGALMLSIHSTGWPEIQDLVSISTGEVRPETVLQAFQRDRATDSWRPVPMVAGQVVTNGQFRRITLMTRPESLTDRYVSFVFNPDLAKYESAVKITQASFGYREGDRTLPILLAPPTTGTTDFIFSVGGELHVENLGKTTGGLFASSLKITGNPWEVVGHVNIKQGANKFANNPLLVISNGLLKAASQSPVPFVLNEASFATVANSQLNGPVTLSGVLNPPAGEPLVNLLINGDATVNGLSIPTGGTIFVTGNLTINNSVTTDANRNIQWLVKGNIFVPDTAVSGLSLQQQILCAEGNIEIYRPIVFSGAMNTNRNLKWIGAAGQGISAFAPLQMNGDGFYFD